MKKKHRKYITLTILAALTVGAIGAIPTRQERIIKRINKDINNKVIRVENIIDSVEANFDSTSKELEIGVKINPIEENEMTGAKQKDLILFESKELAKYTLRALNNVVEANTGKALKKANEGYFGELYDHYNTTIKVYRNDGYIYSYDIIEKGQLRTLK